MNTLRVFSLASTLALSLLGMPQAQAQSSQRIDVTRAARVPAMHFGDADEPMTPPANPRTRESVRAELMEYLASRANMSASADYDPVIQMTSTKTRAEVLAEAAASRQRGDFVHVGDEIVARQAEPRRADMLMAGKR
jgi:hypothetical protein